MKAILSPVVACLIVGQFAAPSPAAPPQPPFKPFDIKKLNDSEAGEPTDDDQTKE